MPKQEKKITLYLKLKSLDLSKLLKAIDIIKNALRSSTIEVAGPIPLPKKTKRYTVQRNSFVNKKSMQSYYIQTSCYLFVLNVDPVSGKKDMEILGNIKLNAGVGISITAKQ